MKERSVKAAKIGVAAVLLGCAYMLLYLKTGIGFKCPVNLLTGLQCPGCGVTRMIASLCRLDFAAAWGYNPVVLLLAPAILYLVIKDIVCWIRFGKTRRTKAEKIMEWCIIGILFVFGVARNLP